jgi:hypothetical protein
MAFYVQEHNARLPHSAFRGQTPDEMYFGTGDKIPAELEVARQLARRARAEANRKRTCSACEPVTVSLNCAWPGESASRPWSAYAWLGKFEVNSNAKTPSSRRTTAQVTPAETGMD